MEADKRQTAFVKIALTGFKQDSVHERIPANVAIVLDKSGSMAGQKIEQAKQAAILAVNRLNTHDIVSVVAYDTVVDVVVPATKVSDKEAIAKKIRQINTNGSTALFAGVSKGSQEVRKFIEKNKVNRVILLSDGLANVGPQTPSELGELGLSLGKEGISVSTIGLGLGYNEDLMTQLAGYSDGNHVFVEDASRLAQIFQYEFGDVLSVVAQGVDIHIECADGIKPLRVLGRNANIFGNKVSMRLNQLYSEQEKFMILEVEVPPHAAGFERDIAKVNVTYNNLASDKSDTLNALAYARFSTSETEVKNNINQSAYEASVGQIVNEQSKKALKYRDQGNLTEARNALKESAGILNKAKSFLPKPSAALKLEEKAVEEEAELLDSDDWRRSRKVIKANQFKKDSQQSY